MRLSELEYVIRRPSETDGVRVASYDHISSVITLRSIAFRDLVSMDKLASRSANMAATTGVDVYHLAEDNGMDSTLCNCLVKDDHDIRQRMKYMA